MVSSRDRSCQRRLISLEAYRQDAAACVSLSKSTMSKTETDNAGPTNYARRRRGGAYLVAGPWAVNRPFPAFFVRRELTHRAQKSRRAAEGLPSQSKRFD